MRSRAVPLRHVAEVKVSNVDKKSVEGEQSVRLCNYTHVYYGSDITAEIEFMPATATARQIRQFSLTAGDVIITKDSETASDIGVAAYVPAALPGVVCGYHLALLRPRPNIHSRFLFWAVQSDSVREQWAVSATGVTRYGLNYDAMRSTEIPLPPLEEQRRIANYLDDQTTRIDQAIQLRQQQVAVAREAFQALLAERVQEMLANMPSTRLSRFFRSVEQGASPNGTGDSVLGQELGVIKTSAIKGGAFHWQQNKALIDQNDYDRRFEIHPGDLLVVRGSGSGDLVAEAAVVTDEVAGRHLMLSDLTYRLSHLTLVPEFVSALFAAAPIRSQIRASIREGSGPAKVRGEDLGAIRVPVVRAEQQLGLAQEFMEHKSQLDRFAELAMKSLAVLRERKEALISEAVTGRFDALST